MRRCRASGAADSLALFPPQSLLGCDGMNLFRSGPSATTNTPSNRIKKSRLFRADPSRKSSDKRQTPDPGEREQARRRFPEDFLNFLCRPLGSAYGLEDETGGGGSRSYGPRSLRRGLAVLTSMCVQADLSRCLT